MFTGIFYLVLVEIILTSRETLTTQRVGNPLNRSGGSTMKRFAHSFSAFLNACLLSFALTILLAGANVALFGILKS